MDVIETFDDGNVYQIEQRVDRAKMPDPDGSIRWYDVAPDDTTPWGLWAKARNKLADKAWSQRGKKAK